MWAAPTGPVDGVLAFTAHHVVAAAVDPDLVAARLPDGDLSAPMGPAFLGWPGGRLGSRPGSLDLVLAAGGLGGSPPLELTPGADLDRHERVARSGPPRETPACWCWGGDWPAAARWRSRSTRPGATAAWGGRWWRPASTPSAPRSCSTAAAPARLDPRLQVGHPLPPGAEPGHG